jgi:membrane protein
MSADKQRSVIVRLASDTWERFSAHGDMLAASISFFALLSLAPLAVIAVWVASLIIDRTYIQSVLVTRLEAVTSTEIAGVIVRLMDAAERQSSGVGAVIAGLLLLLAASRLFLQIEDALNLIWRVEDTSSAGARALVRRVLSKRLVSFAMVLGCGGLLLSALIAQALFTYAGDTLERLFGWQATLPSTLFQPLLLWTCLFVACALVYRVLPDVRIRWRDVAIGALLTSALVLAGTALLGLYLTRIAPAWLQGAAGALAAFMLWVYYLAQVFLLGAAFTRAWSCLETPAASSTSRTLGSRDNERAS